MKIIKNIFGLFFISVFLFFSCSEEDTSNSSNQKNPKIELSLGSKLVDNDSGVFFEKSDLGITITKRFKITNKGDGNLNLSNLIVTGDFIVNQGFADSKVLPTKFTTFEITYKSTSIGEKLGTVSFDSNSKDQTPFKINLTAESLVPNSPRLEFSQEKTILPMNPIPTVDFGLVETTKTITKQFVIKNVGKGYLTLSDLGLPNKFISVKGFESTKLGYNETTTLEVKYEAANSEEEVTGALNFKTNDPIRPSWVQVNLKAKTIKPIHVYFPLKSGNSWTFDRQSPLSTSTSEISGSEITNADNIFGRGVTVDKITKQVYDYFLTGNYFLGEDLGNLKIENIKFFNEYETKDYNYEFTLPVKESPVEGDMTIREGVIKNLIIRITPTVYLTIKKISENENWTVNGKLYENTQNTEWKFFISAKATFSGTLVTTNGSFPSDNILSAPHQLIEKQLIGSNKIRLARDIGPIESEQNINFKDIELKKDINAGSFGVFDATEQLTPIETEIKKINDMNKSSLKYYSVSF